MLRWLLILISVFANLCGLYLAALPTVISYAQLAPTQDKCLACGTPEIQLALVRAASAGRGQIIDYLSSVSPWLIVIALLNVTIAVLVLFVRISKQDR